MDDVPNSIQQTSDGGYIIAGTSRSNLILMLKQNNGQEDYWIIKVGM